MEFYIKPALPDITNGFTQYLSLGKYITILLCIPKIIERAATNVNIIIIHHHAKRNGVCLFLTTKSIAVPSQFYNTAITKFDRTTIKLCGNVASLVESEAA